MSALGNIIRKEIKELLTPSIILPILFISIIFGSIGNAIGGIEEEISEPPVIGVIALDQDTFGQSTHTLLQENAKVVYNGTSTTDVTAGLTQVKEQDGIAVVVIPENFTSNIQHGTTGTLEVYWIMKGAGIINAISSSSLENLLGYISRNISQQLIANETTVNASLVLAPTSRVEITYFKDRELPGLSPGVITGLMSQQSMFIPIIMMMILIMAGQMVITSMAFEKENKTLETLLTLPVKRSSIVTGKIIASALVGLFLSVIYMIGMGYYLQSLQFSDAIGTATSFPFTFSELDYLLIGVSLFVTLVAALALCMFLGTFAKNYKSAQTLIFPIVMFSLIPMFINMFSDFDTLPGALQALLFAIPFSHPMMAPRELLFDNYILVLGGIVYSAVFAIVMISLVVWMFKTDKLLTGSTRLKAMFSSLKKRKNP